MGQHRFVNVEPWECSDAEYFDGDCYGSSSICRALGYDGPSDVTGELGNAVHIAVLQPDIFADRVVTPPAEVSIGSGAGQKERMKEWRAANASKIILTASAYETALAMRDAVTRHQLVGAHLAGRDMAFERSFRAIDSVTGLHIRVRADAMSPGGVDDLKKSKDPAYGKFRTAITSYGYHIQAALYVDVLAAFLGRRPRFHWLVVGSKAPYRVGIYQASEDWLELGRRYYAAGLDIIAASRVRGTSALPWWSTKPLVMDSPPDWLTDDVELHERYAARVMGGAA